EELQQKSTAIKSLADGKRIWAELAESYSRAAKADAEAVKELKSLPADRADPVVVGFVAELAEYLTLQEDLLRKSADQCGQMAALFAAILADGDTLKEGGPKDRVYQKREADLNAEMKRLVENEGAAEKRRLYELMGKAKTTRATLSKKHVRSFP